MSIFEGFWSHLERSLLINVIFDTQLFRVLFFKAEFALKIKFFFLENKAFVT